MAMEMWRWRAPQSQTSTSRISTLANIPPPGRQAIGIVADSPSLAATGQRERQTLSMLMSTLISSTIRPRQTMAWLRHHGA